MTSPVPGYLGVDLGTSGLKLTLVGADGSLRAESEASYDVRVPEPGHAETDPADWEAALTSCLQALADGFGGRLAARAVGVTGQMHGVVLVDADERPVRPAVLWPDQRAVPCLDRWRRLPPALLAGLANPLAAGMAGPIVDWLHTHERETVADVALVRSPKDWLRGRLTGDRLTERSDASATLLWDVPADDWSAAAFEQAGLSRHALPDVVRSDAVVGTVGSGSSIGDLSRLLPGDAPVVAGGADTACAVTALEAACDLPWERTTIINVGTGVQILRPRAIAEPRPDPISHLYADTDDSWYEMLAVQNGGLALTWAQEMLGLDWAAFVAVAQSAAPGCGGVCFVPFLTGERGALASADATAGWTGLTPSAGRAELARSAFEGLAYTVRRGIDLLGGPDGPVLVSGGGSRDAWVRQLLADVLGLPLTHVRLRSASAVGAAVLAARGVGETVRPPVASVEVAPGGASYSSDGYERWLTAVQRLDPAASTRRSLTDHGRPG